MADWKKIYTSAQIHQAEIVRAVLEDHAMNTILINKTDSVYGGVLGGVCEVFVKPENVIKALKIIEDDIQFE